MPLVISGKLSLPITGRPASNAQIRFRAVNSVGEVIQGAESLDRCDASGNYNISLEFARYELATKISTVDFVVHGQVTVGVDTVAADLEDLITQIAAAGDITDELINQFTQLKLEAEKAADDAEQSAKEAADNSKIVMNPNLIGNSGLEIAGSVVNPPDATPRKYNAGDELFAGHFATGVLTGVTYVDGLLNGTGQLYVDVSKSQKQQESIAPVTASIAGSDGLPKTGASVVDNATSWRVTYDMSGTFSIKLEQGGVATRHSTQTSKGQSYTFNTVADMVGNGVPIGSSVEWLGRLSPQDGGGGAGIVKSGNHTDDGFTTFSLGSDSYVSVYLDDEINIEKAGYGKSESAANNSIAIQKVIDLLHSRFSVLGGYGDGGGTCVFPSSQFDFEGFEVKNGVNFKGAGLNKSVLNLVGDNKTGIWCKAKDTQSFADQVAYGEFKGFSVIPKDPSNLTPVGQVIWDIIGFSRWKATNCAFGWCGGVVAIRATGGKLAGSGGPAQWYNDFNHVFIERPSAWPAGGTGWLLGESDAAKEQITTWTIVGGRTSGAGTGLNIQGANTVTFVGHAIENTDVIIADDSGSRLTRNVCFSPGYFEGDATLTINNNAFGTCFFGEFSTGYTVVDKPNSTIWNTVQKQKSVCPSGGSGFWEVEIENGAVRRPKFKGSTLPGVEIENSSGDGIVLLNGRNSSDASSMMELRYNGISNILMQFGTAAWKPGVDNSMDAGAPAKRIKTIHLVNAPSVTSDERLKSELLDQSEVEARVARKINIKKYKYLESIERKGEEDARIHFGVGAQSVIAAFESEGLNPFNYALLRKVSWGDDYQEIYNDKGVVIDKKLITKAGWRYEIVETELLMFKMAAI